MEYTITPLGLSLQKPLEALHEWALYHGADLERAQAEYDLSRG